MKKYLLYLIFTSICLLPSFALGTESKCIEGDCRSGQGTLTFSHGGKYVGEFEEGKFHGQGTYTYPDGSKYVGEWKDGERHGRGVEGIEEREGKTGYWLYGMYVGKEKPEELKEK